MLKCIFLFQQSVPVAELDKFLWNLTFVHGADGENFAEDHNIHYANFWPCYVAHVCQIIIDLSQEDVKEFQ